MGKKVWVLGALLGLMVSVASAETLNADPTNYNDKIDQLQPGDTLILAGGDYDGMNLRDVAGTSDNWITIRGADGATPARILADPNRNTVQIRDGCRYLALENIVVDGLDIDGPDAINASGGVIHHIRIEDCTIVNQSAHQQSVGISTKVPTWGWVVRGNTIVDAGTGIYFGNSNGSHAFVGGLIENNLFLDCKGYNMQIKHQWQREDVPGMPTGPMVTIIRNNVFIKDSLVGEDGARPNLLVDGFPDSGNGSEDMYEIYGNVFYHNHTEVLLQAAGRVSIHDNIFMDTTDYAIYLTDHNQELKVAYVYNNTFYDCADGIRFAAGPRQAHNVVGNLIFTDGSGISGNYSNASDNIVDSVANAGNYVNNPTLTWGQMDFYPKAGQAEGTALDLSDFDDNVDFDKDFNGESKGTRTFRGAYAGSGTNPGWQLDKAIKGLTSTPPPGPGPDTTPPTGTIEIEGGAATTPDLTVDLSLSANDSGSGMGSGAEMAFSNDGISWSPAEPYAATRSDWELHTYGGSLAEGSKTVYVRFRDAAGNWSSAQIAASIEYQIDDGGGGGGPTVSGSGSLGWWTLLLLACPLLRRRRA